MKITDAMQKRAEDAIANIPTSGGLVLELYQVTLRQKLSQNLIKEIARVALEAAFSR